MATCPFSESLSAYHDDRLDERQRSEIERHLPTCPSCAAELAQLRAISGLFASASQPRLSQIAQHRLHFAVDEAMDEGVLKIVRVLSAIAACVLVAGSLWLVRTRDVRTVENTTPVAPPWADVGVTSDSPSGAYSTPAAAWYLADDSLRSDDAP
jgi:anti-sigma factor RsiW